MSFLGNFRKHLGRPLFSKTRPFRVQICLPLVFAILVSWDAALRIEGHPQLLFCRSLVDKCMVVEARQSCTRIVPLGTCLPFVDLYVSSCTIDKIIEKLEIFNHSLHAMNNYISSTSSSWHATYSRFYVIIPTRMRPCQQMISEEGNLLNYGPEWRNFHAALLNSLPIDNRWAGQCAVLTASSPDPRWTHRARTPPQPNLWCMTSTC